MQRLTSSNAGRSERLWLATSDGRLLSPPRVAPIDGPELAMTVRFEGLTDAEKQKALAAFPGGRRFVLAS